MQDKHIVMDGSLVSERVSQVVSAIREYSHELDVEWVPPTARKPGEAAFRVIHRPLGREPYVIFHVKTEEEMNTSVLKRIIQGDARNGGKPTYGDIEAAEEAAKLVAKQKILDQQAEVIDKMYHVFKSPLNTYKLDKNITIKDGIPFNAKGY